MRLLEMTVCHVPISFYVAQALDGCEPSEPMDSSLVALVATETM